MIVLNRLNNLEYVNTKIKALTVARQNTNDKNIIDSINLLLSMLSDAKYKILGL